MERSLTLRIGNSSSTVLNYSTSQFNALREALSYTETKKSKWSGYGSVRKYLVDRKGNFPTGLLYLVEETLSEAGWRYETQDTRVMPQIGRYKPASLFLESFSMLPRPEQAEAVNAALAASRGIVVAPTGTGKSLIAAMMLDAFQVKSLVVVPSLELKRQFTEGLQEYFGGNLAGPLIRGEPRHLITVENIDQLSPMKPLTGVDLVLIDEFHHSAAKSYRELNMKAWDTVYFKFGLTATPFRSKDEERLLLESVLSKVIYKLDYETAVSKNYITPMEVYSVDLPPIKFEGSQDNWHNVYKKLVVDREDRNEKICDMIEALVSQDKATLVLVKQVEHAKKLQYLLKARGVDVPIACGENDDGVNKKLIEDFNDRKEPCLIGTSVIGEGIDTRPTEYIILAGGGKSKPAFMQQLGRGFRRFANKESCKIIMFNDQSHKWLLEHHKQCCKYLRQEYGLEPAKLPLKD